MPRDDWKFLAGVRDDTSLLLAVCKVCGLMRRRSGANDQHIDLRGECPGEPQEPEARKPPGIS